jgi:UDP-3-O-[3-hydroxymyristoyl] glucosamine N-acyltransferase
MTIFNRITNKHYTLNEIQLELNAELIGDSKIIIKGISSYEDYRPETIVFYTKKSLKIISDLISEKSITSIVLSKDLIGKELPQNCTYLFVQEPMQAVLKLIKLFYNEHIPIENISPKADIHPSVKLGANVRIASFACISEDVEIGSNVIIYPHVVIYPGVKIADNVIIHSHAVVREHCEIGENTIIQNGAVIGADGFGYVPDAVHGIKKVPQVGNVLIAQDVEIGANTCVDRATLGSTRIGLKSKLDNLVQVGHNVQIGNASFICGQVGIAGSCKIGNQVVVGGQVGIADHLNIPDKTRIAGGSIVMGNITEAGDYSGIPAMPSQNYRRMIHYMHRIGELFKK